MNTQIVAERPRVLTHEVEVGPARLDAGFSSKLVGLDDLRAQVHALSLHESEERAAHFHDAERTFVRANAAVICSAAEAVSTHLDELMRIAEQRWDGLHHFHFHSAHSEADALLYRYVYVPLAYRLGYYTLAAKLSQMTFEALLPGIERSVRESLERLTGYREAEAHALVHERFTAGCPERGYCYSRPKTPHSVWKKIGSAARLAEMSHEEFAHRVDDYMGVVWIMPRARGESAEDAISAGLRAYDADPDRRVVSSRRSSALLAGGVRVAMAHAVWRGIPIEAQFFGGEILGWLTAMDYAEYKTGMWLDGIRSRLTDERWEARGRAMLRMYERSGTKRYEEVGREEFHAVLLREVMGDDVEYGKCGGGES